MEDAERWEPLVIGNPRQSPRYPGMQTSRAYGSLSRLILGSVNWGIVAGFLIVFGFFGWVLWQGEPNMIGIGTLGFVIVGWVFSLCLHEFSHALTAVLGGDTSPSTLRYLSFNPLHYTNLLMSIVLPVVFILIGGFALPGGAVYLRRDLIRNRFWQSAISLAGPLANTLFLLGLALLLRFGPLEGHDALRAGIGVLAFFQAMAVVLNLLPIPPLDGFGVILPWLPRELAQVAMSVAMYAFILLFVLLFFVPQSGTVLFGAVNTVLAAVGIDPALGNEGLYNLYFFRGR